MKCYVVVGCKYGDIFSVLPILYHEAQQTGKPSVMMVSRKYSDCLTGCSYVKPLIWEGDWTDLRGAIVEAKKLYEKVIVLSTFGKNWPIEKKTPSFQLDQWERSGEIRNFGKWPLVFDKRNHDREKTLVEKSGVDSSTILVGDISQSSPFHNGAPVEMLAAKFPDRKIVKLSEIKAECIYDLLGLYDKAACLVSIETMHLHLSAASGVPVVALVTDKPELWHGTAWQKRFSVHCRYQDYEMRKDEIVRAVQDAICLKSSPEIEIKTTDGYNPTMHGDWTIYRRHTDKNHWRTKLAATDEFKQSVDIEPPSAFKDYSIEDARFFEFKDKPHISYTVGRTVAGEHKCVMQYGELKDFKIINHFQPKFGKNDFTAMEKNWSFWSWESRLFAAYQRAPEQIVIELDGDKVINTFRSKSPDCAFGQPRGGTYPIPFQGGLLQFVHSNVSNPKSAQWWNYSISALVMENRPPFAIKQFSKFPILVGNEKYFPNNKFWKPKIFIPYGAVEKNVEFHVSIGWNDSACAIAKIKPEHLNL